MTFSASVNDTLVSLENDNVQRVVDTCCLGCVFAKGSFKQDKNLKFVQACGGCELDILNKMQTRGEELQESIDNDGNEFYVIRGRICPYHRPPTWSGWQDTNMDQAKACARKEVTMQPDVVIYFDDTMEQQAVLDTAEALHKGKIRPRKLYLVNNSDMKPSQVMKLMSKCPLPWRVETVVNGPVSRDRAMDMATAKCTSIFITYFMAGYKPPENFFVPMDVALHDNLDRFILLSPESESINGLTVLRQFHKQAGGSARKSIVEKAKKISKDQQCQYLVRPVTEITQL